MGKTRLFNKSTSSKETDSRTPSPLQKRGRNRPNSTYVNVDSGYDSDQTNLYKNLYSFITADIEKMSVQEKVIKTNNLLILLFKYNMFLIFQFNLILMIIV